MPRIAAVTAIAVAALVITPLVARPHTSPRPALPAPAAPAPAAPAPAARALAAPAPVPAAAAPAAGPAPAPAATSVMVSSFWGWPGPSTAGASLPLIGGDCARLKLRGKTLIGYVQAPSGASSRVLGSCVKGTTKVTLEFPGLTDTGATYAGSATIAGQLVTVTVVRSVTLLWPLLALMAGIALALLILHLGPKLILDRLLARLKRAQAAIGTPAHPGPQAAEFARQSAGRSWANLDISASVASTCARISADLKALRRAKWLSLTPDDAQFKALDSRVAAAEGAGKQLAAVASDLMTLSGALPGGAFHLVPAWCATVRERCLGRAGPLAIDELAELAADADDACKLAAWLPDAGRQVDAAQARLDELKSYQASDPRVQAEVARAVRLLDEALADFTRAETSAGVRQAYEGKFIAARTALDGLNSVQVPPRAVVRGIRPVPESETEPVSLPLSGGTPPTPRQLARQAAAIVAADEGASIMALIVVCGLLIFAGLQALAIGKTFGTPWDFVAAVAWGSGAVAVGSPLASAIESFGQIRVLSR